MRRFWFILAALAGLAVQAVPASADLVYTLNCNAAPCNVSGNYGTVTLSTISSSTVRVAVDLAATGAVPGETFANSSAGYAITWDITGDPSLNSVSVVSALTPHSGSFSPQNFTSGQGYKASPFTSGTNGNDFNYAIEYGGATGTDNKLVFDVTLNTGLVLTDFIKNPNYRFAVDIAINGNTFNVASNGPGVQMPEPKTWLLLLAGLALLPVLQRRRKPIRAV